MLEQHLTFPLQSKAARGFTVVANKVQSLAKLTHKSTEEIKNSITRISDQDQAKAKAASETDAHSA